MVARLARALLADQSQDETVTTLWAAFASRLLESLAPEQAALLERRLEAAAKAAEELPPSASVDEIFDRGRELERTLS
jgi:hypothetical protein